MRVCLMIEGQEDVGWGQWLALAAACEAAGIEGLFRSDHYLSVTGQGERGSLDAWATLAGLAARTERLRLGTMVSPATFRHPSVLAKIAITVDHISGGRVEVGIGAGWHDAEHAAFGFPLPEVPERLAILAEQVEVIHGLWTDRLAGGFRGAHYRLQGVRARPEPVQRPHPPLILGGSGGARSVALAARFADEYNTIRASVEECRERSARLRAAWTAAGRDPETARLSVMTTCIVGADRAELHERIRRTLAWTGREPDAGYEEKLAREGVIGTVDEVVERLTALEAAGVGRIMARLVVHDDLDMIALLGRSVAPAVA